MGRPPPSSTRVALSRGAPAPPPWPVLGTHAGPAGEDPLRKEGRPGAGCPGATGAGAMFARRLPPQALITGDTAVPETLGFSKQGEGQPLPSPPQVCLAWPGGARARRSPPAAPCGPAAPSALRAGRRLENKYQGRGPLSRANLASAGGMDAAGRGQASPRLLLPGHPARGRIWGHVLSGPNPDCPTLCHGGPLWRLLPPGLP